MKKPFLLIPTLLLALSAAPASAEEVYFFRGGFDVFSTGMNQMAAQLRGQKIKASAHSFTAWRGIAEDIVQRSKKKKVSYPIVVLGHSFGADVVPEFANYLGRNGIATELVVGFDPTGRRTFTKGAKKAVNYRTHMGGHYTKGDGFRGKITEIDVSTRYRGANHVTIEKVDAIQNDVLASVRAAVKSGKRRR